MGYVAGPCPNIWGYYADGSTVTDAIAKIAGKREVSSIKGYGRLYLSLIVFFVLGPTE